MIVLNLKANDEQQEILKQYLQENVSEILADKINNGIKIEKDGKQLISKKDLDGFFDYACNTAQKQAEKGKHSACVKDNIVFGWAMHYFEEDSIEGKLYNPDGTPYEPPKPKYTPKPVTAVTPPPKKEIQPNMFDLLSKNEKVDNTQNDTIKVKNDEPDDEDDDLTEEERQEVFAELEKEEKENPKQVNPIYTQYTDLQNKYPDCIVTYRLGDFYEIFGDNAVKIANVLDLTLTSRDFGLQERIPVIGFPYHAADLYMGKLVDKGFKVAVVESLNDIKIKRDNNIRIDMETGEILQPENNNIINVLFDIFGDTMEIRL